MSAQNCHSTPCSTGKWARGGWSGSDADEKRVKDETQATLRCFPFDQPAGPHTCFMTGQPAPEEDSCMGVQGIPGLHAWSKKGFLNFNMDSCKESLDDDSINPLNSLNG
eukprot:1162142-Pelagomonas_calceolata.AAC.19